MISWIAFTKHKHFPFIIFAAAVLLLSLLYSYHAAQNVVHADIYGSVADPTLLATIQSLDLVEQYLPGRIKVTIHPVMKLTDDKLESYVLKTQDAAQLNQLTEEELVETMRLRALLKLHSDSAIHYLETRYRTELTADEILDRLAMPAWLIKNLSNQARPALIRDSQRFAELVQQHNLTDFPVPQLFLNGELYQGAGDPQAVTVRVARLLLRNGAAELPTPRRFELLGGRLAFALSRPYRIKGFPEAMTAADCNDRTDKTGVLIDQQTPYQRCHYQDPLPIKVFIYGETTAEHQQLLDDVRKDIKGLASETITNNETKEQVRQAILALNLPENFLDLTREPYLVFAATVTQDPAGAAYYESGLFIPLSDGRLLFNTMPFNKK